MCGSVPTADEYQTVSRFLRRVSPCRLAAGNPLPDNPLRLAEQNRNVLLRVQAVADEKWHDDHVLGLRKR